jgi:NADH-quinone oxidoreductase subunit G
VEAGLLPGLLPAGRPLADATARGEMAKVWGVPEGNLPAEVGRDLNGIIANADQYAAFVVGAFDPNDTANPAATLAALEAVPFIVSLEQRVSAITDVAHVVLPVAPVAAKSGTFINWEGRARRFEQAQTQAHKLTDARVLAMISDAMDVLVGQQQVNDLRAEINRLGEWNGARVHMHATEPQVTHGVTLATWNQLIDAGSLQEGEPFYAATARPVVAYMSQHTANTVGAVTGDLVSISTAAGSITAPAIVTIMADNTVWLPTNNEGSQVRAELHAAHGSQVTITQGGAA